MFAEYTGPFDTSLICLISGFAFITMFWPENFGNAKGTTSATSNLREAFNLVRSSPPMTMLGCSVACFESAMYVFVFQWSGALQRSASIEGKGEIPLGLVFACFMAAIMVGSRFFVFASAALEPQAFLPGVIFLSSVSLFITASQPPFLVLLACLMIFELSCGVYFPSIGAYFTQTLILRLSQFFSCVEGSNHSGTSSGDSDESLPSPFERPCHFGPLRFPLCLRTCCIFLCLFLAGHVLLLLGACFRFFSFPHRTPEPDNTEKDSATESQCNGVSSVKTRSCKHTTLQHKHKMKKKNLGHEFQAI